MTELPEDRRRLAEALRGLREDAGMSTTQLAQRLGWSQSKVSKTERGATLPPPPDVAAWAAVTQAPAALRAELVELAERETLAFSERRRVLAPGARRAQQEIQRLEESVSAVRVFNPNVIVGLAQTRDYVAAMFRMGRRTPPESFDAAVDSRLARQASLADENRRFALLMGEAAVRRRVIAPAAMRVQLERLVELSRLPNVEVGVIPFDAVEREHQSHGYSIMGDPDRDGEVLVWVSIVTRILRIRDEGEIREYLAHFDALRTAALVGDPLRAFLAELIDTLPTT